MSALLTFILGAIPALANACAVCFGQTGDPNIGRAYFWGIVLMLAVTGGLLAALAIAIYRIELAHRHAHPEST